MNLVYSLFSVANLLSIARIFLAIPLYYSLAKINSDSSLYDIYIFLFICLLIALSDVLDGYFARLFNSVSDIGKFLDPFADKVCVLVFILFLSINIPGYFILFICLLVRDLVISFFSVYFARKEGNFFQANIFGKWFLFFIATSMILSVVRIPDIIGQEYLYLKTLNNIFYVLSWTFFTLATYQYFSMYYHLLRKSDV